MNRKIILLFCLFLPIAGTAAEYKTRYDQYLVKSVGDYIYMCDALNDSTIASIERDLRITSCISFVSGILTGYRSTLAIKAEFDEAAAQGVTRKVITTEMDSNDDLHEKLEEAYFDSQFLCFPNNLGLFDIALSALIKLKNSDIDPTLHADYQVLNEIEKQLSCNQ